MLDKKRMAIDAADEVGRVTACVKIAMTDLSVIIGPDRVIALTDMNLGQGVFLLSSIRFLKKNLS
jgi:hypothetical protein